MRQRDVAALGCKIHEGAADAKAENDALRDDVAAGRRRLHIVPGLSPRESHHRLRRISNAASPDWQETPPNGIISPSERGHYAKKQLEL